MGKKRWRRKDICESLPLISTELPVTLAIGIVDDSDGRRLARVQIEYICLLKRTKVLWQIIRLIGQGRNKRR